MPWCLIPQKGTAALASWKGQINNVEQLRLRYLLSILEVHEREVTNLLLAFQGMSGRAIASLPPAFSIIL